MFSRYSLALVVVCLAFASAFIHKAARPAGVKLAKLNMKSDGVKALVSLAPLVAASPAFASDVLSTSMPLSLEVTFAAYLAVLLGTFVPVTFLIVLYSQSEARKAGAREGF